MREISSKLKKRMYDEAKGIKEVSSKSSDKKNSKGNKKDK